MQIDLSFARWKALTGLLQDEDDTYDAVIGRLLGGEVVPAVQPSTDHPEGSRSGVTYKGVFLPNGTKLSATYKGQRYYASISESKWIDNSTGQVRSSPSQAAYAITGGAINGWLFWSVKRPQDPEWQSLNKLRWI
jgi:hypothetical protein